jgi:hypothetical protein
MGTIKFAVSIAILATVAVVSDAAHATNGVNRQVSCGTPKTFLDLFDAGLCEVQALKGDWATSPAHNIYSQYVSKVTKITQKYRGALVTYFAVLERCTLTIDCYTKSRPAFVRLGPDILREFDHFYETLLQLGARPSDRQAAADYDQAEKAQLERFQSFLFQSFSGETLRALREFKVSLDQVSREYLAKQIEELRQERQYLDNAKQWLRDDEHRMREFEMRRLEAQMHAQQPDTDNDNSCQTNALLFGALAGALSRGHATAGMKTATAGLNACQ